MNLRCAVVDALARTLPDDEFTRLSGCLEDESEVEVLHALDGYLRRELQPEIAALERLTARPATRRVCIELLSRRDEPEAFALVWGHVIAGLPGVRAMATKGIVAMLGRVEDPAGEVSRRGDGDALRTSCESLLEHHDDATAAAAARLLCWRGDPDALPALLRGATNREVNDLARELLAHAPEDGARALEDALTTPANAAHRAALLTCVGALPASAVPEALQETVREALAESDDAVVVAALETLGYIAESADAASIFERCADDGVTGEMAADAVARVLRRAGQTQVTSVLGLGLAVPMEGPLARNICRIAATLASDENVPLLVMLLGSHDVQVRAAAAHALGSVPGDHGGVGALSFALADEESHVRAAACRSLGSLQDPVSARCSQPRDDSSLVRGAAVQALVRMKNPVASARIREVVIEDPSPTVVVHAIAGLEWSRDEQTLGLLMSLCSSRDTEVVKASARALRGFQNHRATAALIGLLTHERWDVRWMAAESLGARGDATALGAVRELHAQERDPLVLRSLVQCLEQLSQAAGADE